MESYYRDEQGLEGWFEVSSVRQEETVVISFVNTTAFRRAEQQLQQQADFLNTVLGAISNGVVVERAIRDQTGTIVDFELVSVNPRAAEITKNTVEGLVGKTELTLHPNIREAGFFDSYVKTIETGEPQTIESRYTDNRLDQWFLVNTRRINADELVSTFQDVSEVRQGQQELKRAADELQAVIDNSQTGIFVFTPEYDDAGEVIDFRFKTINKTVAALIGETPDAIRGDLAANWFISYRDTETFSRYKTTLTTGEEQRFDINYNVDGLDVWFDVRSVKLGDDVLVTFTDYTDLKALQLAQERQAGLLRSVLDGSINGIMSFHAVRDETGTITDFEFLTMNEAAAKMVGKTLDEVIGKRLRSVFPGNVESGLFDKYVHTTNTGEPSRTEVNYQFDGLNFWFDISAQKLDGGFVVTFTDISVVKRSALLVEQSAAELQTVIDTTNAGIFLIVPVRDEANEIIDFQLRVANRVVSAFAGQDPNTVVGGLGSTWFPDYMTNGLFERYKHTYLTGETQQFDMHYEGDILDRWVSVMATKLGDQVLVTFSDFTELKKLQQQLEASVIDLQRSNRNLEQFAYVASHDLQEPLRKIQQFGDILQISYADVLDETGRDMLGRMQSAAGRMRVLIKDVLAYSRIATKREDAKPIDLNKLLRDVTDDLETAIADANATILIDTLPIVAGDGAQLRQLFQNLISNALKFIKPGRRPEIRLRYTVQRGRDTGLARVGQPTA